MKSAGGSVEGKIEGQILPGSLFNGAEAGFRSVAKRNTDGGGDDTCRRGSDRNAEKSFVGEGGEVETEAAEVVADERGAANFRSDGVAEGVGEGKAEGERSEFVDVGDEAPAVGKQGLNFELLLVAALFFDEDGVVGAGELEAAVDHAKIGVLDGSVFGGASAKFGALGGAAFREEFGA